ncbi:dihydroorotase [Ligilactobacillus salitolerans]|uniref:Dihydroorotase n=1 Tax=Ligilactobacillus salitolerans TaxID=1808352 RepID=A0A401IUY0_9LACO|nr:dihydroorotase [Ligilactobacillus salitolerans]GBG95351.1 dihydroorotase [Ligilactobacillus salitolerans]
MKTVVIKNGQVWLGGKLTSNDLLVKNGQIAAVGQNLSGDQVLDASGLAIFPGLIDGHVHLREPGQTAKEDISSGTMAAAHGGYTTVCAMANVTPVPDTPEKMQALCQLNADHGHVRILQYAPVTENLTSEKLTDFQALHAAGAFALSNDGKGIQLGKTMYAASKQAALADLLLAVHAQDDGLFNQGVINDGPVATRLDLRGIPAVSETTQVARDLLLAAQTKVRYHICHVSTKETVELVRQAKAAGIQITCEVTPHHLLLSQDDIQTNDPNYKMNPPLRTKADKAALITGIQDGTIDVIATDHAPHTKADKAGGFAHSAFGITGSETAFGLLYTELVKTKVITLARLIELMSSKPAEVFRIPDAGQIMPGKRADLAFFDLNAKHQLAQGNFLSKGSNSPFVGKNVYGQTVLTMVAGQVVYRKQQA